MAAPKAANLVFRLNIRRILTRPIPGGAIRLRRAVRRSLRIAAWPNQPQFSPPRAHGPQPRPHRGSRRARAAACIATWWRHFWRCARRQQATASTCVPVSSFRDFDAAAGHLERQMPRRARVAATRTARSLDARALDEDALVSAILHVVGAARRQPPPLGHGHRRDRCRCGARGIPRRSWSSRSTRPGACSRSSDGWLDANAGAFRILPSLCRGPGRRRSPEPWHLSHAPVARQALRQFSLEMLQQALDEAASLDAGDAVRRRLPEICRALCAEHRSAAGVADYSRDQARLK